MHSMVSINSELNSVFSAGVNKLWRKYLLTQQTIAAYEFTFSVVVCNYFRQLSKASYLLAFDYIHNAKTWHNVS